MFRAIRDRWLLFKCSALGHNFGEWERNQPGYFWRRWCSRCGHSETGVKASTGRILPTNYPRG
jgi:hypothetical protein